VCAVSCDWKYRGKCIPYSSLYMMMFRVCLHVGSFAERFEGTNLCRVKVALEACGEMVPTGRKESCYYCS